MRFGMTEILMQQGHEITACESGEEAFIRFQDYAYDLVITDLKMEGMSGLVLIEKLLHLIPDTPILMVTAFGTIELAVEAMQKGAFDFVMKPFPPELLRLKVKHLEQVAQAQRENNLLQRLISAHFSKMTIANHFSSHFQEKLSHYVEGKKDAFVYGEMGCEVREISEVIFFASRERPYQRRRFFCSEQADLDTMTRELRAVRSQTTEVWLLYELEKLSDTQRDHLFKLIQGKPKGLQIIGALLEEKNDALIDVLRRSFSEWSFIEVPPLRLRSDQIPHMVKAFIESNRCRRAKPEINPQVIDIFKSYPWPGNWWELKVQLERLLLMGDNKEIVPDMLPAQITLFAQAAKGLGMEHILDRQEKEFIKQALYLSKGVKSEAAELLSINASALYRKMEKYDLS